MVHVYQVGEVEDEIYVAMEFLTGPTLRAWLAAKPRSRQEVLAVFRQAGEGLAAAHRQGVIHRDFKPEQSRLSQKAPISANAVDLHQTGLLRERRSGQGWSEVVRMAQTWPKSWARSRPFDPHLG